MNKRVERGRATREQLIEIATRLFAERGYDGTSIEAVLQESGLSRGGRSITISPAKTRSSKRFWRSSRPTSAARRCWRPPPRRNRWPPCGPVAWPGSSSPGIQWSSGSC
ncbi:TetR/AcrR family transcriptional regulator [Fodinicola feengrottensis]|uniref:TetR/AcrR family transcriptional regulator n=1 Tax=Fodinicola feengrottensis TaxID=435914 RepID=UPI0036F3F08A